MKEDSIRPGPSADNTAKIRKYLLSWYIKNRRDLPWRRTDNPYYIWVSEIMLQQTQVNTVIPYYERFIDRFPDIRSLADADLETVIKLWEGLGYYARIRNFHRAAKTVADKWSGRVPDDWETFIALPGVGDYIASAVLSIAFAKSHAVVDGNVKRVFSRLYRVDAPVNAVASHGIYKSLAVNLLCRKDPSAHNQAVMELGALICRPKNPNCPACPLNTCCLACADDVVDDYPRRQPRRPVPEHQMVSAVILKNDRVLIVRRPEEGLLGGLWEFPGARVEAGERAQSACERLIFLSLNVKARIVAQPAAVRHAFTHFKIVSQIFICQYISGRVNLDGWISHQWVRRQSLDRYAFSKTALKVMGYLQTD